MRIHEDITSLIGGTPLLELSRYRASLGLGGRILGKLEYLNPAGSSKDRIALAMIKDAESSGRLAPGGTVIEPTSGNTGIGIAMAAAARGYRAIMVMPDTMSAERRGLIAAYGAEIVLTPGAGGMSGSIAKAEELAAAIPNSIIAGQFENPANPRAHFETTGPELWADTDGQLAAFVAGVGSAGTITGTGRFLKSKNPAVRVVAVEPADSPLISRGRAGKHDLQGIGANFIPENYDPSVTDEIITVTTEEAFAAARSLARLEGALCGITSGAALHAAAILAARPEFKDKMIAVLLPDTGTRYLSTGLFG